MLPLLLRGEVEGEERERLERHVASCDTCRARLETLRPLIASLRAGAATPAAAEAGECREAASVMAYADGTLDASDRPAVESHLARCTACRTLLADLWTMDAPAAWDPPPRAVRAALSRLTTPSAAVVRLVKEGLEVVRRFAAEAAVPETAPAGARAPDVVALSWGGPDGLTAELNVTKTADRAELVGRLLVRGAPDPSLTVGLRGPAGTRGPETTDEAGRFGPWSLGVGENTLVLRRPGTDSPHRLTLLLEDGPAA
jgi:anti-sigma factor RsiW